MDKDKSIIEEGWITTIEAAELTGYARAYIRQLILRGRIKAQKVGAGLWLVNKQSLLDHQRNAQTGRPAEKAERQAKKTDRPNKKAAKGEGD